MEKNFSRRQFVTSAVAASAVTVLGPISPVSGNETSSSPAEKQSWKSIGKKIYGAKADEQGPIGGGKGYKRVLTKGDFTAENLEIHCQRRSPGR